MARRNSGTEASPLGAHFLHHRREAALDVPFGERQEQRVLRWKVLVQRADRHAGPRRDVIGGGVGVAALRENVSRGRQQALDRLLAARLARCAPAPLCRLAGSGIEMRVADVSFYSYTCGGARTIHARAERGGDRMQLPSDVELPPCGVDGAGRVRVPDRVQLGIQVPPRGAGAPLREGQAAAVERVDRHRLVDRRRPGARPASTTTKRWTRSCSRPSGSTPRCAGA